MECFGEEAKTRGVVVGYILRSRFMPSYDHRASGDLSSESFYRITVKVFQQKGFKVYGFHQFAFTPLVVRVIIFFVLLAVLYYSL